MSLDSHLKALFDSLIAWEAEIQERLGYVPKDYQACRCKYITEYLNELEKELKEELESVKQSRCRLKEITGRKVTIQEKK